MTVVNKSSTSETARSKYITMTNLNHHFSLGCKQHKPGNNFTSIPQKSVEQVEIWLAVQS